MHPEELDTGSVMYKRYKVVEDAEAAGAATTARARAKNLASQFLLPPSSVHSQNSTLAFTPIRQLDLSGFDRLERW